MRSQPAAPTPARVVQAAANVSHPPTRRPLALRLPWKAVAATGENMPLVSVVIPAYNNQDTVEICLRAVFGSDYPTYEVILVNDNSTDKTLARARAFDCRFVDLEKNLGAAGARNRGAALARGEILFFVDADVIIESDTISRIAQTFQNQPDISAVFCSYQKDTCPQNFCSTYKNLLHHYTHQTAREDAITFCAGFGAIQRAAFVEMGGFDESYRSLEDIELGYRLSQADHAIYLNKAIQVTHCKRYSLLGLIRSDLLHRAIPWTQIMLDKRVFRSDLNTKSGNVASVFLSYCLLLSLPLVGFWGLARAGWTGLLLVFLAANRRFYAFLWQEKGLFFLLRAIPLNWMGYLYSGAGAVWGGLIYLRDLVQQRKVGQIG